MKVISNKLSYWQQQKNKFNWNCLKLFNIQVCWNICKRLQKHSDKVINSVALHQKVTNPIVAETTNQLCKIFSCFQWSCPHSTNTLD